MKISVVLTHVDRHAIPGELFNQMQDLGIRDVYIVLNECEFKKAMTAKFKTFDDDYPAQTILEHCRDHRRNSPLRFHLMNAGQAQSDEAKFQVYFDNLATQYDINILLRENKVMHKSTPALNKYDMVYDTDHNISYVKLSNKDARLALTLEHTASDQMHYQWFFKSIAASILFSLSHNEHSQKENASLKATFNNLTKQYSKNISRLENTERNYCRSQFDVHVRNGGFWKKHQHEKLRRARTALLDKEKQSVEALCELYSEIAGLRR